MLPFLCGALIAAVAVSSLLMSVWLWLYQTARSEIIVPQHAIVCSLC